MRENGFRAIGGLAQRLASGIAGKSGKSGGKSGKASGPAARGAPLARLKAEWAAIVGADLARLSQPEAILAGRGARNGAAGIQATGKALRLRVAGAAALEIQHRAPQLVERVNAYFGHRLIDEIRLMQGGFVAPPPPRKLPAPDPEQAARIARRVAEVKDPDLKAALARLGGSIAASRRGVMLGAVGTFLVGRSARAQSGRPQATPEQDKALSLSPADHVLGKTEAPNVIIDYFSLTCPHCANFHAAVLPNLRSELIDTGKVRFVYRHFPSDSIATHASQLTECAGAAKFFETIDVLFKSQVDWLTSSDAEGEMLKLLRLRGLVAGDCYANDRLLDKIVDDVQSGQTLGVHSTPTLFTNGQNVGNPGSVENITKILGEIGR